MRKITLLFALLLSAGFVFGQFTFGPKVGFNTSELKTDLDGINSDLKNSFNFGVFLRVGKKIYVQPEVNWLTRGGVFKSPGVGSLNPINQEIEMKTIEVPLILGWRIINLGVGNVRLLAGPSASIVMDKTIKSETGSNFIDPIKDTDLEDLIWGFNIGAGVDVLMFTLDVRYQMGLNEVIQKVEGFDFNSKNNIFSVSLGWKLL